MEGGFAGLPVHAAARDFESLPAELPSHVVDRLLRQDPPGSAAPVLMDSIKVCPCVCALCVGSGSIAPVPMGSIRVCPWVSVQFVGGRCTLLEDYQPAYCLPLQHCSCPHGRH